MTYEQAVKSLRNEIVEHTPGWKPEDRENFAHGFYQKRCAVLLMELENIKERVNA